MIVVDLVDTCASDGFAGDEAETVEITKRLLHGPKAVMLADEAVHLAARQASAGAEECREHCAARPGDDSAEWLTEVHVNRIMFIRTRI
jgi:hypothetical protein